MRGRESMTGRFRASTVLLVLISIGLGTGCSSLKSHATMIPREANGIVAVEGEHGDRARYEQAQFTIEIGTVAMGSRRLAVGPCLLPFVPDGKEWPRPLMLEVRVRSSSAVTLYPARWQARARAEEFGKFFGKDEFSLHRPHNAVFYKGDKPWELNADVAGSWNRGTKASGPLLLPGDARGRVLFPVYDNHFIDFVLSGIEVEVRGQRHALPPIAFRRKSDWEYSPFTLAPAMPYPH